MLPQRPISALVEREVQAKVAVDPLDLIKFPAAENIEYQPIRQNRYSLTLNLRCKKFMLSPWNRKLSEPLIKVCGIQTIEEAQEVISAGANSIGLLVGITHVADDKITDEMAKRIVAAVPKTIRSVLVTHLLDAEKIIEIARDIGVDAVQIHDDLSIEEVRRLREELPNLQLLKAIHVTGREAIEKARQYAKEVDMLLLDSRTTDRLGGTGKTHDWAISRQIVEAAEIPVILAGGLNPDNIDDAIEQVHPAGIDANSGLENDDGTKNFDKVRRFVIAGRRCSNGS